jgi:4-diphosphocytidyl-2-C-methyl-D-erythritol kinase
MIKNAFAKVNLALDILGKGENGYHKIQTIMQQLPIMDQIMISQEEGDGKFNVRFRGDEAKLIDPQNNTVVDAIKVLNKRWEFKHNYNIIVDKIIPLGAGLGGGSCDAAAIITALNSLEIMKLSLNEMREIGAEIGMDVPFFIENETAYATNHGEKIKVLPRLTLLSGWSEKYKILVIPQLRKSTKQMYNRVDLSQCGGNTKKTEKMFASIESNSTMHVFENLHNDFEKFAGEGFEEIKQKLLANGADYAILCGSGTAVLGLSNNPFDLKVLSQALPHQRILNLIR